MNLKRMLDKKMILNKENKTTFVKSLVGTNRDHLQYQSPVFSQLEQEPSAAQKMHLLLVMNSSCH